MAPRKRKMKRSGACAMDHNDLTGPADKAITPRRMRDGSYLTNLYALAILQCINFGRWTTQLFKYLFGMLPGKRPPGNFESTH